MGREIKFRIWNPERKVLTSGLELNTILMTTDGEFVKDFNKSGMTWMQYIGVNDKNNKEIYEDDIVEAWNQGSKGTFVIKWRQEGSPCWILYPAWQSKQMWHISATKHTPGKQFISVSAEILTTNKEGYYDDGLEVIGNVHQNSELLKVS